MNSRRKQTITEEASLETTVPTDLSFSPDEVSELYTTDDDRLRVERSIGKSGQVTNTLSGVEVNNTKNKICSLYVREREREREREGWVPIPRSAFQRSAFPRAAIQRKRFSAIRFSAVRFSASP